MDRRIHMILFLQDFIRQDHLAKKGNETVVNYFSSELGKTLKKYMNKLGIPTEAYDVTYAFPRIPKAKQVNNRTGKVISYVTPKQSELAEFSQTVIDTIIERQPSIIIPTGSIGCKLLLGVSSISKLRGKPEKITLESSTGIKFTTWVFPIYSVEYQQVKPNIVNITIADYNKIGEFYRDGEMVFTPKQVEYDYIDDIDELERIFNMLYSEKPITAWDLETNTIRPEIPASKILVMSMSYKEGQGLTFPLNHAKAKQWNIMEYEKLTRLISRMMADTLHVKVGHNIKFDIKFLRMKLKITDFQNIRDTKVMYYQIISQEVEKSFTLSDLAYELTDMGGYDKPLEDYKEQFKKNYMEQEKAKLEKAIAENKQEVDELNAKNKEEYNNAVKAFKERKRTDPSAKPPKQPEKIAYKKFPAKSTIKLINEVDGGNFNYEWIPIDILVPYASGDTDCCLRIHNKLIKQIAQFPKMYHLTTWFYPMLVRTLAHLEATGFKADRDWLKTLEKAYTEEQERLTKLLCEEPAVKQVEEYKESLYAIGLEEFKKPVAERDKDLVKLRNKYKDGNTAFKPSGDDKGLLLFKILKCKVPYDKESIKESTFTKGTPEGELIWSDYKTDKHVLNYLVKHGEQDEVKRIAQQLLDISKVSTLKNGFTTKLLELSEADGRIHGGFNETGTQTSRLSSTSPNMQQIPSKIGDVDRFDYQYPIKRAFVSKYASEGGALIQGDYQALEMRVGGLASMDDSMITAFLNDEDLHTDTAMKTWGLTKEQVTSDLRKRAKAVS